jgi:N-acetylmuramic acid 6-phosphate etherase
MSDTSRRRAEEFLRICGQFKLGVLTTESSHPVTANLSEVARQDVGAGLKLLFDVDNDVVCKYREFVDSGRAARMANTIRDALLSGGNIFFTGCGSTGRLSIQLVSIWRDFWQRSDDLRAKEWEKRAFPVMAGGDFALIKAVEGFEDFTEFGKKQIGDLGVCSKDVVFAITEGGETSFVIGTAWKGIEVGAKVYFVYNNPDDVLCQHVQRSREVIQDARIEKLNLTTGPMGITGSTRMQATSIQLAVLLTVLEMVVRELTWPPDKSLRDGPTGDSVSAEEKRELFSLVNDVATTSDFHHQLGELHATLKSPAIIAQLARLVAREESVYRAGRKVNYFANQLGIDMLTDTTERSPTYCTPPFRKFDDTTATESWAFLYVPYPDSPTAWERICKRTPRCVEWKPDDVRGLVPEDKFARTVEVISKISYAELMRFRIGLDGIRNRPLQGGDCAVALVRQDEMEALFSPHGFFRQQLEAAREAGAKTGVIFLGSTEACARVGDFIAQWNPDCAAVLLPVPNSGLLNGVMRVGLKMLLNTLSTCTMVRLGRVMGNTMIWVVPSNLKLIDRATRYIQKLTGLEYLEANHLLFEVIEYVEPRMKADQSYPPVVGVSVMRHRHGLSNEAAEKRLKEEMG